MRIAFAGSPAAAVPSLDALLASRHEVVTVVTREDSPIGRRRVLTPTPVAARAGSAGVPVVRADRLDETATRAILAAEPDLGVIVAYGGLVREPLLSAPRLGWINLHFSLLPRWRGAAPVQHALLADDRETGVCVFRLVPELDAGPVYARLVEPIGRFQTAGSLLERLAGIGAGVLAGVVDGLADGTAVATPQTGEPTFAGKLGIADGVLDWSRGAQELDRRIRATSPEPGASTTLDGQRFKVVEAVPAHDGPQLPPGRAELFGRRVLVGTGSGLLELLTVTPFGRPRMAAADWFRGRPRDEATVLGG
ncbi:MAG: methionyl-tRNA formyltransferase [Micrococcales bacterium 73-13]|nr:MAG: methionyl-tRNA formyltransferase [Micrococcales bacterium 73-13]